MSRQITKVLIVEDNPQHLKEAVETLTARGLQVVTANDAKTAEIILYQQGQDIDGVITDLFMPIEIWRGLDHANEPAGLHVAATASRLGKRFVLCTSGSNHGLKYELPSRICSALGWVVVHGSPQRGEEEAQHKQWEEALDWLLGKYDHLF